MLSELVQQALAEMAVLKQQVATIIDRAKEHDDRQREVDAAVSKLQGDFDRRLTKLENFAISARTAISIILAVLAVAFYAREEFLVFVLGVLQ